MSQGRNLSRLSRVATPGYTCSECKGKSQDVMYLDCCDKLLCPPCRKNHEGEHFPALLEQPESMQQTANDPITLLVDSFNSRYDVSFHLLLVLPFFAHALRNIPTSNFYLVNWTNKTRKPRFTITLPKFDVSAMQILISWLYGRKDTIRKNWRTINQELPMTYYIAHMIGDVKAQNSVIEIWDEVLGPKEKTYVSNWGRKSGGKSTNFIDMTAVVNAYKDTKPGSKLRQFAACVMSQRMDIKQAFGDYENKLEILKDVDLWLKKWDIWRLRQTPTNSMGPIMRPPTNPPGPIMMPDDLLYGLDGEALESFLVDEDTVWDETLYQTTRVKVEDLKTGEIIEVTENFFEEVGRPGVGSVQVESDVSSEISGGYEADVDKPSKIAPACQNKVDPVLNELNRLMLLNHLLGSKKVESALPVAVSESMPEPAPEEKPTTLPISITEDENSVLLPHHRSNSPDPSMKKREELTRSVDTHIPPPAEPCAHKMETGCQLAWKQNCCSCADQRPQMESHPWFEDPRRRQDYCPSCKEFWDSGNVNIEMNRLYLLYLLLDPAFCPPPSEGGSSANNTNVDGASRASSRLSDEFEQFLKGKLKGAEEAEVLQDAEETEKSEDSEEAETTDRETFAAELLAELEAEALAELEAGISAEVSEAESLAATEGDTGEVDVYSRNLVNPRKRKFEEPSPPLPNKRQHEC